MIALSAIQNILLESGEDFQYLKLRINLL